MSDHTAKFPRFLRDFISYNHWTFREVQTRAFDILFDTDNHLLISAGTSSGKTEAAFFPVISDIYNDPCESIGALYISPLKALINDQYDRLIRLVQDNDIMVTEWHGDIPASRKKKILSHPRGILQITPESLQSILIRNYREVPVIFKDLRYVIIDEVHTFMNSDRGLQLLCILESIERMAGCTPRRIGLSATLSELSIAELWLKANSSRKVSTIVSPTTAEYRFGVMFRHIDKSDDEILMQKSIREFYTTIYRNSNPFRCIIFSNNRHSVEATAMALQKICKERNNVSKYVGVHHGSVSSETRTNSEKSLKDPTKDSIIIATSTLELGIDVGDLDRVLHINCPSSVSSLVQKVGRSGRRNGKPTMIIVTNDVHDDKLPRINIELIKSLASIDSFLKDNWVEPIIYSKLPFSLLYQQTMAYMMTKSGVRYDELKRNVLSMYPFRYISDMDYKIFLQYLIDNKDIQLLENGEIIVGLKAESTVKKFDFCTIFETPKEILVRYNGVDIGTVQDLPAVGQIIRLAGSSWVVKSINKNGLSVNVEESHVPAKTYWNSGAPLIHTHVMNRMWQVLFNDVEYDNLDPEAKEALATSRKEASDMDMQSTFVDAGDGYFIFPWFGTIQFDTLLRILDKIGYEIDSCVMPYYIYVRTRSTPESIVKAVYNFMRDNDPLELVNDEDVTKDKGYWSKYDQHVSPDLLKKAFSVDRIDYSFDFDSKTVYNEIVSDTILKRANPL